jgi:hypothetical protein
MSPLCARVREASTLAMITKLSKSQSARNLRAARRWGFRRATPCQRTCHVREPSQKNTARRIVAGVTRLPPTLLSANGLDTSESSVLGVGDTRRISRFRLRRFRSDCVSLPMDSTRPREASRRVYAERWVSGAFPTVSIKNYREKARTCAENRSRISLGGRAGLLGDEFFARWDAMADTKAPGSPTFRRVRCADLSLKQQSK